MICVCVAFLLTCCRYVGKRIKQDWWVKLQLTNRNELKEKNLYVVTKTTGRTINNMLKIGLESDELI